MARAIALANQQLPPQVVGQAALVCRSLCWDFPDYHQRAFLLLRADGTLEYCDHLDQSAEATITVDASTWHGAAFGGLSSFVVAFLTGKLRVTGGPEQALDRFMPLIGPFLASYRQACQECCGKG